MPSGYSQNKDARAIEEMRKKSMAEEQERKRKAALASELATKKEFLFSTTSVIEAKNATLHTKELSSYELESELRVLDIKLKTAEEKVRSDQTAKTRAENEQKTKSAEFSEADQKKQVADSEHKYLTAKIGALRIEEQNKKIELEHLHNSVAQDQADIMRLTRELESKKTELAQFQSKEKKDTVEITSLHAEEVELERKNAVAKEASSYEDSSKKSEVDSAYRAVEKMDRDLTAHNQETEAIKRQIEEKKHSLSTAQDEHSRLKREIEQLARDKTKLEGEIRTLELHSR